MTLARQAPTNLVVERLEPREVPAVAAVAGTTLVVAGTDGDDRISVFLDGTDLVVLDGATGIGRVASAAITTIAIDGAGGNDVIKVDRSVTQVTDLMGGDGNDKLVGGGGAAGLTGDAGDDVLLGGPAMNTFNGDGGRNELIRVKPDDVVIPSAGDVALADAGAAPVMAPAVLTADDVETLLRRASAASASSDAIIAITDRNGRILGVRVESGVAPEITGNTDNLVFAIDGAVAKARTGAFFGNNQGPLTSRTVQFISQSTITQREVESNPSITDPNSTQRGPGFVAPVNIGNHFPPGIAFTPQVDLFQIEHTNRDSSVHPGDDRIKGTADDVPLAQRFNIDPAFVPAGQGLFPPDSYGFTSGIRPASQSRGIATLPGGIPIYKNGQVVGGIGVFFPGKTGFATEENSSLSTTFNPALPDRTLEAEWIAFATAGGTIISATPGIAPTPLQGPINGVGLPTSGVFGLPTGRLDLVGIQLDVFGQGGAVEGTQRVLNVGNAVGVGNPDDGVNQPVDAGPDGIPGNGNDSLTRDGLIVPEGWLVTPHDGDGITKADVERIVTQGIVQSNLTRAAIRVPLGTRAKFVFAVADRQGNIVGLYREPDATVFSIDVAVAKARNVAYYADPNQLQPIDQVAGVPPGVAFTNRTFRYLGLPRFPEGIDGNPAGPFSQLYDDVLGTDPNTGKLVGPPLPASVYDSVVGYDSFNPGTNFHQQGNVLNQNGIVFFPGSAPVYKVQPGGALPVLSGGFGVSGDGVDQDDVTTVAGQAGFDVPAYILRADQVFVQGVRLPYQKGNRNPEG
ncbi:heme-binding protein [bacterium]|nr:heme-binding protein [bacterium]